MLHLACQTCGDEIWIQWVLRPGHSCPDTYLYKGELMGLGALAKPCCVALAQKFAINQDMFFPDRVPQIEEQMRL